MNDEVAKEFANPIPFLASLTSKIPRHIEVEQKDGHTQDVCRVNGKTFMTQPGKGVTEVFQVWVDRSERDTRENSRGTAREKFGQCGVHQVQVEPAEQELFDTAGALVACN